MRHWSSRPFAHVPVVVAAIVLWSRDVKCIILVPLQIDVFLVLGIVRGEVVVGEDRPLGLTASFFLLIRLRHGRAVHLVVDPAAAIVVQILVLVPKIEKTQLVVKNNLDRLWKHIMAEI